MHKMAIIFVNGAEKDPAVLLKSVTKAVNGIHDRLGMFSKGKMKDVEVVTVHVLDTLTIMQLRENVDKYGIKHFLQTNDMNNPDPMQTVLIVGPEEADRMNKMSAGLRLF